MKTLRPTAELSMCFSEVLVMAACLEFKNRRDTDAGCLRLQHMWQQPHSSPVIPSHIACHPTASMLNYTSTIFYHVVVTVSVVYCDQSSLRCIRPAIQVVCQQVVGTAVYCIISLLHTTELCEYTTWLWSPLSSPTLHICQPSQGHLCIQQFVGRDFMLQTSLSGFYSSVVRSCRVTSCNTTWKTFCCMLMTRSAARYAVLLQRHVSGFLHNLQHGSAAYQSYLSTDPHKAG